jgi:hypothetical protein
LFGCFALFADKKMKFVAAVDKNGQLLAVGHNRRQFSIITTIL